MEFTFLEYFLIILAASFIIFSLAIRSDIGRKIFDLSSRLRELKQGYERILKSKKGAKELIEQFDDELTTQFAVFKDSLVKITSYIFHTFYLIFLFSLLGVGFSLIVEMNIFGLTNGSFPWIWINQFLIETAWMIFIIHLLAFSLLYVIARAIYLLIVYNKIDDFEYANILQDRIATRIVPRSRVFEKKIDTGKSAKIVLHQIFFFFFWIRDKNFREFFFTFYDI